MAFPHSPKHLIQIWSRWVASGNHIYLMMLALLIVWWIVISNLMIIDVWDESTARIFFQHRSNRQYEHLGVASWFLATRPSYRYLSTIG